MHRRAVNEITRRRIRQQGAMGSQHPCNSERMLTDMRQWKHPAIRKDTVSIVRVFHHDGGVRPGGEAANQFIERRSSRRTNLI